MWAGQHVDKARRGRNVDVENGEAEWRVYVVFVCGFDADGAADVQDVWPDVACIFEARVGYTCDGAW